MDTISVIVPVYNVELFLDRCLSSITSQSYKQLEIILVDDGSTDQSGLICDRWSKKDRRIKVIHKKNEGLGFARNSGLGIATGKFLSFVDSDDYLEAGMFQRLVSVMNETKADICYFGCSYDDGGRIINGYHHFPDKIYSKAQIKSEIIPISFGTSIEKNRDEFGIGSVCCGFYLKAIFDHYNLKFDSERKILCEDIYFTSKLLLKANRICFLNENYYIYFINNNSLTHSYKKERFENSLTFYNLQKELIEENNLTDFSLLRAKYSFLINLIVCIRQECTNNNLSFKEKKKRLYEFSSNYIFRNIYRSIPRRKLTIKKRLLFSSLYNKHINLVYILGKH